MNAEIARARAQLAQAWRAVRGDGCTAAPDLAYTRCCNDHDRHYRTHVHADGAPITRGEADRRLFRCMRFAGKTPILGRAIVPAVYWCAVRLFGRGFWRAAA